MEMLTCPIQNCPYFDPEVEDLGGFSSVTTLRCHLERFHKDLLNTFQTPRNFNISQIDSRNTTSSSTATVSSLELPIIQVSFHHCSRSEKRRTTGEIHPRKNSVKGFKIDKENARAVKASGGPCLRCKILKKQCDSHTTCLTCPEQDSNAKEDHWKVLGCFRGPLSNLDNYFRDGFSPAHTEYMSILECDLIDKIQFVLVELEQRPQLFHPFQELLGTFCQSCYSYSIVWMWDDPTLINATTSRHMLHVLGIWTMFSLDYYNNQLLRLTALSLNYNCISVQLSQRELENVAAPTEGDRVENIDRLGHLRSLLINRFVDLAGRKRQSVTGKRWLDLIWVLICWSIMKSIDIDWLHLNDLPHQQAKINQAESIYKALVSVFDWVSARDLLTNKQASTTTLDSPNGEGMREIEEIQVIVERHKWEERGIKSTKDFLMGLGSGFYSDGAYKGFYVQQYRLEEYRLKHEQSREKAGKKS